MPRKRGISAKKTCLALVGKHKSQENGRVAIDGVTTVSQTFEFAKKQPM